jgi:single-strand DNA-binding protein
MSIPITVKGNVGSEPELKFSKNNKAWATFNLAHTPRERKGEEWVDGETIWFRVVTFGNLSELITDNLQKGDNVIVTGVWKQSKYTAKDGTEKTALEINASDVATTFKPIRAKQKVEEPSW